MEEQTLHARRWAAEIRETNLAYLMLAQAMIRSDKVSAMYRLGCSEAVADVLAALTPAQVLRIASGNALVCRFRFDDSLVWSLLADHARAGDAAGDAAADGSSARLHASILSAGRYAEAV